MRFLYWLTWNKKYYLYKYIYVVNRFELIILQVIITIKVPRYQHAIFRVHTLVDIWALLRSLSDAIPTILQFCNYFFDNHSSFNHLTFIIATKLICPKIISHAVIWPEIFWPKIIWNEIVWPDLFWPAIITPAKKMSCQY